jgi:SOS-response transcriptional repressor LexA
MKKMANLLGFSHASGYQRYELEDTYKRHRFIKADIIHKLAGELVGNGDPPITKREIFELGGIEGLPEEPHRENTRSSTATKRIQIEELCADSAVLVAILSGAQPSSPESVRSTWSMPTEHLRELGVPLSGLYLVRARDDSMARPDGGGISPGDLLLVNTNDCHPSPAGIFAIDDGFGLAVRRAAFIPYSEPPRVEVRPDNPTQATHDLPAEKVRILGRCAWVGGRI